MKIKFKDKKILNLVYTLPPHGNFGTPVQTSNSVHWDHCREQFAIRFDENSTGFYFCHPEKVGRNIVAFILKFEKIVKSSLKNQTFEHSTFAYTNNNCILFIEPSFFWRECFFKRSLFTILCRVGQHYSYRKDNFDAVLFDQSKKDSTYLSDTKPAVLRFMFGFTKYVGIPPVMGQSSVIKHGWREEFHKLDEQAIRSRLVSPTHKKPCNIVGFNSLWA